MPHLHHLLKKTLLLTANPSLQPRDDPNFSIPKVDGQDAKEVHFRKVWHYEWDPSRLTEIANLTARNRTMGDMDMLVCQRIAWGAVKIRFQGKEYELPPTQDYLVESYFLDGGAECRDGEIKADTEPLWPLPAVLHSSYQLVFAYQMPRDRGRGSWERPSKKDLGAWEFIDAHADLGTKLPVQGTAGPGWRAVELQVDPLRVVVVLTLGLATERDNFDPGGILGAARIYPVVMAVSNMPLERVETRVEIERPPRTQHTRMGEDEMVADIRPIFVTDRNPASAVPAPFWDKIFEYYDMSPDASDRFAAVKRDPSSEPRELKDAVEVLASDSVLASNHYKLRSVTKMPRQGEFDSIHLAPKMKPPDKRLYSVADDDVRKLLHNITMAPFCAHDCLHVHWRWSRSFDQKHALGWDGFTPYSKAGAPMVPPNQNVEVRLLGAGKPGIEYVATAHDAKPGHWQVFFHHGMAYSISTSLTLSKLAKFATRFFTDDNPLAEMSWWSMYFHLRYEYVPHVERDLKVAYLERVLPGGEKARRDEALRRDRLKRLREF